MNKKDKLTYLLAEYKGTITANLLKEKGIEREYLSQLKKECKVERVGRGIYIDINIIEDSMFNIQYWFKKGIFSHGTALYLHQLTDRTLLKYTMTFPRKYNVTNVKLASVDTYSVIEDKYSIGINDKTTNSGNKVKVYSMERTLCDIVRKNSRVEKEMVINAYKMYAKRKGKKLNKLYEYARTFKVYDTVKKYIEVLLWLALIN